jgi:hypothetical protein
MKETFVKICFAAIFFIAISSCEKRSCNNVTCPAGQECVTGACVCADGTEGTNCATLSNTKYIHSYYVSESCNPIPPFTSTNVFIQSNPNDNRQLYIYNLFGGNCNPVIAVIHTDGSNQGNTLEIPSQNCSGNYISGRGSYDPSNARVTLLIDYTFNNGTDYQCTETLYQQ